MTIESARLVYFSPTHTSQRIGEAIIRGTGLSRPGVNVNVTTQAAEVQNFSESTLAVIAVPVYGGHVAPQALERLKGLRGAGTPAVLAVVYGNRAYEKALTELDAFVCERGFKVIAAGTFIGEHSFSNEKSPIAPGRPDATDLSFAEEFGRQISEKIAKAPGLADLYAVDVLRIPRPKQSIFQLLRFLRKVVALRKSNVSKAKTPVVNEERCIHCGICVSDCPGTAILKGDECHTDEAKCIKCCACVKGCPQKARMFDSPFAGILSECFGRQKEPKTLL